MAGIIRSPAVWTNGKRMGSIKRGSSPLDTAQNGNLRERGLNMGKQVYLVDTPVATVWTSAQSPGAGDEEALRNPANMKQWLTGLSLEQRHELWRKNNPDTGALRPESHCPQNRGEVGVYFCSGTEIYAHFPSVLWTMTFRP